MKFTKIPEDAFKQIQLNAGMLVESFTPSTGEVTGLVGATTGGITFSAKPTFSDYGEDIDNCPKNMMELKKLDNVEATMSGTFVTVSVDSIKTSIGIADIDSSDSTHIIPRRDVLLTDYSDIWWVGDYSEYNGETNGGFVAIHLKNSLPTGGFSIKSADKAKGQFSFEFTGHYSMDAQNVVPYEIYIKSGTAEPTS